MVRLVEYFLYRLFMIKGLLTWKYGSMLLVVAAGIYIFIRSIHNDDLLTALFSLFAVVVPVLVWISDSIENKKQQKKFDEFHKEVKNYGFEIIENPEWLTVEVDAEKRILFGIRRDGSVDWSIGVPGPIKKELDELKKEIAELKKKDIHLPSSTVLHP